MTYFIDPSNTIKDYNYCENAFLPHFVVIPVNELYKNDYKILVKPGDVIKEGELLGYSFYKNEVTNLHSSIPGTVSEISPCYLPNGKQGFGIKINIGGKFSFLGKKITAKEYGSINKEKIIETIKKCGVVNTFNLRTLTNLASQLEQSEAKSIVVRLFDEDNYRITDSLNSKFYLTQIKIALDILVKTLNVKNSIFVVDQKCSNLEELKDFESESLKVLEMNIKRYPNGTEREIISAFNRTYKKSVENSLTRKDLFIDSSTLLDVYNALIFDTPVISKNIYFSGNCLNATSFLNVRTGTSIREAVKQLGGFIKEPEVIIINGVISGSTVHSLDVPITKYVKSITFISKTKKNDEKVYNCVNCGNCRFICPRKISPDIIYKNISHFKDVPETASKFSLACTNCGLCNTVCPSRLPLCQTINAFKEKLQKQD